MNIPQPSPNKTAISTCFLAAISLATYLFTIAPLQSAPVPPTDNTMPPYMGVYEWGMGNQANIDHVAFSAAWLSRSQLWVEDFASTDTWDNLRGPGWLLNPVTNWIAQNPARMYILTEGMLAGPTDRKGPKTGIGAGIPVSLALGATGTYNSHYQALAQSLVSKGLANNTIIRLGHEFDGSWYTWCVKTDADALDYAAYWRQIVTTMRAVPGAQNIKFCWNDGPGWRSFDLTKAYPGDAYVDYIAFDYYDQSWAPNTYPYVAGENAAQRLTRQQNAWNDLSGTSNHGLTWWKEFAASHGKPLAIGEWGLCIRPTDSQGGGDNPYFVQKMYDYIQDPANNVAWHIYFDVQAGDGHHQITPYLQYVTEFTTAAALAQELFSPSSNPAPRISVADSYVRDGTYAAINYGTETSMTAKLDASSYSRESYIRFNVGGLANASSVKIVLTPASVGTDGATTALSYEFLTNDSWTETGLTWNNRPTASTVLGTSTGYVAGQPFELDVTAQAKAEAAGDGLFSLRIRSTVAGSLKQVNFGTRENTTAIYRPVLQYTLPAPTIRSAVADSYVRDGTYAAINYGTETAMAAKLDAVGYSRESYIRFDVTGLANASSVKIVLTPESAGTDGVITTLSYELLTSDSWTETGINWNNRPTASTVLGTSTGYVVGQPIEVDVTAQAKQQAAGDGLLSLRIRSTVAGSQKTVSFSSRESVTTANRPVMEIIP